MNRIISEELYERIQKSLEDVFDARLAEDLRNAPSPQPPSGQVGEVPSSADPDFNQWIDSDPEATLLEVFWAKKGWDAHKALRQPVETVGRYVVTEEQLRKLWVAAQENAQHQLTKGSIDVDAPDFGTAIKALRTQPQAPVVEVPSLTMQELESAWDIGVGLDSDHKWPGYKRTLILNQIHALLQSRKEPVVEVPNISEAVEEISEARMTVLDSMEKQSTVKVIVQYLDNAVALLQSKGGR